LSRPGEKLQKVAVELVDIDAEQEIVTADNGPVQIVGP
jgi:hypothetical protein